MSESSLQLDRNQLSQYHNLSPKGIQYSSMIYSNQF